MKRALIAGALEDVLRPVRKIRHEPTGMLGGRVTGNVRRLLDVDLDVLLAGFRSRPGAHPWIGEHIGKWIHAACLACEDSGSAELRAKLDAAVQDLIATQESNGYLGTYAPGTRLGCFPNADWDVWTHKYCLIGLTSHYDLTGQAASLDAAIRAADLLVATFGDGAGQTDILRAGTHVGMAATSVLEPVVLLHRLTGDVRYRRFAEYIVSAWDRPGGPRILSTLLTSGRVSEVGNGKAYEMLSNILGLLHLARVTGDPAPFRAAGAAWDDIVANHLYVTGTASFGEHFHRPGELPDSTSVNMGETCVTVTWLQLTTELLNLTGDAKYAAEVERTIFNHLAGAQRSDGSAWCYYSPLQGTRDYGSGVSCCISSGPRGMAIAASSTLAVADDGSLVVLQYQPLAATLDLGGANVDVRIETAVPSRGGARFTFTADRETEFDVRFRHPGWATGFSVDGQTSPATDGWIRGPRVQCGAVSVVVEVSFGLGPRLLRGTGWNARSASVHWGPLVMAYHHDPASTFVLDHIDGIQPPTSAESQGQPSVRLRLTNPFAAPAQFTADASPFATVGETGRPYRVWVRSEYGTIERSVFHRARQLASSGDPQRGSFNDYDPHSFAATEPGQDQASWFALDLDESVEFSMVVFVHGRSMVHGGWFDSSTRRPTLQIRADARAPWVDLTELTDYPPTTAADDAGIEPGQRFVISLPLRVRSSALRVLGDGAFGDYPPTRFATCALLQAFA